MLIAEEFLLLALDDTSGKKRLGGEKLAPALGGALIAELALGRRVGVTAEDEGWRARGRVRILAADPPGDAELDRALAMLSEREGDRVKNLLSPMSGRRITKGLADRLLERLSNAGVLSQERSEMLGFIPVTRWPSADPGPEREVRQRLRAALVDRLTPTERTVALIALLQVTGLVPKLFPDADKRALKARAKELAESDWAARAVKQVIEEVQAVAATAAVGAGGDGGGG